MPTTDDLPSLIMRRARREYRVPTRFTPLTVRNNFNETALVFTTEEAQQEANRCVDCDTICSLCVGVCPNLALMTYQMDAVQAEMPTYEVSGSGLNPTGSVPFRADQQYQISVLTDFCNECGNCVTACPTSGRPYEDKPRLYLDRDEFDAESDNAFLFEDTEDGAVVFGRFEGATHRLSINGSIEYTGSGVEATLDEDLRVTDARLTEALTDGTEVSLEPAATMYVVWKGMAGSMPEVPVSRTGGTLVPAPNLANS